MIAKVLTSLLVLGALAHAEEQTPLNQTAQGTTPTAEARSINRIAIDRTVAAIQANAVCESLQERAKALTNEIQAQAAQSNLTINTETVQAVETLRNRCGEYSDLVNYLLAQLGGQYYYYGAALSIGAELNLGTRVAPSIGPNVGVKAAIGPYLMFGNRPNGGLSSGGLSTQYTITPFSFSHAKSNPLEPSITLTILIARGGVKSVDDLTGWYVGPGADMPSPLSSFLNARTSLSATVMIHTTKPVIAVPIQLVKWTGAETTRSKDIHIDVMKFVVNNPGADGRAPSMPALDQEHLTDFGIRLKELGLNLR